MRSYKIPAAFAGAHREVLDAWDGSQPLFLAAVLPAAGFRETDALEMVNRSGADVVRPVNPGAALRLRQYAQTLPPAGEPTAEEVSAVLARRNPAKEQIDE